MDAQLHKLLADTVELLERLDLNDSDCEDDVSNLLGQLIPIVTREDVEREIRDLEQHLDSVRSDGGLSGAYWEAYLELFGSGGAKNNRAGYLHALRSLKAAYADALKLESAAADAIEQTQF